MADRTLEGLVRLIDKRKAGDKVSADSMIDLGEASGVGGGAGEVPSCTVDGDDAIDVFEPYGLAGQAASSDALLLAPGGDVDNQVALLSSVAGRPATDPGDKALWTAAGHLVYLDNDGSLKATGKDGATIELPSTGGVVITAASLANITLVVNGAVIKLGDDTATLGVARQTDAVGPTTAMSAWGLVIETFINGLAPGTFTPANSFAGTVQSSFGTITGASTTTFSK